MSNEARKYNIIRWLILLPSAFCLLPLSALADYDYADSPEFELNLLTLPVGAGYDYADSPEFQLDLLTLPTGPTYDYADSSGFSLDLYPVNRGWADSGSFSLSTQTGYTNLRLAGLDPNPNEPTMEIMDGGVGYRYYQILNENDRPINYISVQTNPPLQGPYISNPHIKNGKGGIVKIIVHSQDVSNGQSISITHLNGQLLPPEEQFSFTVNILDLYQTKRMEIQTSVGLGISNFEGEAEGGLEITLRDRENGDAEPEVIAITRKALLGAGVGTSAGVKAGIKLFGKGGEAGAKVSAKVLGGGFIQDQYGFNYEGATLGENLAKLYLLLYPAVCLNPNFQIIQAWLEVTLLPAYFEKKEGGLYLKGVGSAYAGVELDSYMPTIPMDVKLSAELEGSLTLLGSVSLYANNDIAAGVEIRGDVDLEAKAAVSLNLPLQTADFTLLQEFFRGGAMGAAKFELVFDPSEQLNEQLKQINLTLSGEVLFGSKEYEYQGNQYVYQFMVTGPSDSLQNLIIPQGILLMLQQGYLSAPQQQVELTLSGIMHEIDRILMQAQSRYDLKIEYVKTFVPSQTTEYPIFEVDIGVAVGLELDLSGDLGAQFIEKRDIVLERGAVIGVDLLPTQSYGEEIYDTIDISITDVYLKTIIDTANQVLPIIFDYAEAIAEAGQEIIIDVQQAVLEIGQDIVEVGQKIAVIFQPEEELVFMAAMESTADPNEIYQEDYFGIGGIYQLEPNDLVLSQPATFTISYTDDDVGTWDENLLKMYRWDSVGSQWELIGGTVDVEPNRVVASIDRFGIFTLGARVPYGRYSFTADPNSAPADGSTIITWTSEWLYNNDNTPISDGSLFTVYSSCGDILTADANDIVDEIQVSVSGGRLQFDLQVPNIAYQLNVSAASLIGQAQVTGSAELTDSVPPDPPQVLAVTIVQGKVKLTWDPNAESDVTGYMVYFDDDQSGPPYEGIVYSLGSDSPIDVADSTEHFLKGLRSGHTYYITITACDIKGNESLYGLEIIYMHNLPDDSDSDGLPNEWEYQYKYYANGLNPLANDALLDNDRDGLNNWQEYNTNNNPLDPDTDDDGIEDSYDTCPNTDPNVIVDARGCMAGDYELDGDVDIADFAAFALHWLDSDCGIHNDWCGWTDFNQSTDVGIIDLHYIAQNWLKEE